MAEPSGHGERRRYRAARRHQFLLLLARWSQPAMEEGVVDRRSPQLAPSFCHPQRVAVLCSFSALPQHSKFVTMGISASALP
ncbi:hypothetical protein HPP92_019111 [Vanilla planifolia]|uniref:Uncharacterized protein n=1 Tax=Vanilla planifolia TaxID=51239 RepID=A0A835UKF5_VANPL|nr:hypothetical protein HPP92_019111 [Vanilla planifolia]